MGNRYNTMNIWIYSWNMDELDYDQQSTQIMHHKHLNNMNSNSQNEEEEEIDHDDDDDDEEEEVIDIK